MYNGNIREPHLNVRLILCTSWLLLLLLPTTLLAEQLSFSKQEQDESYLFTYQWLDSNKNEQGLSFQLSKNVLFNQFRDFQNYQPTMANLYINKNILKAWRRNPILHSELNLVKERDHYKLVLTANNNKALMESREQLSILEKGITQQYFEEHYYHRFINHNGLLSIKPNHIAIADASVDSFKIIKPLILSQVETESIRVVTNYILGFSQAIPYSELQSRTTSSGQGFNTPYKLLWENQGDCDSKVTMSAAILRALMPRVKIIMVFIDGHALMGIEARPQGSDVTLVHNKQTYVLGEPTGPAIWPLGTVAQDSEQAVLSGLYHVEEVR